MDKNTLSNYGWIVIAVLVLSVMIALATPFGSYVKNATESTLTGLFDTSESALNVVGMSAKGDGSSGSGTQTPTEPDAPTEPTPCTHTNTKTEGKVDATCTEAGHTGKTVCADCGETVSNGSTVSALGHTTDSGTCSNCGEQIGISTPNPIIASATFSRYFTNPNCHSNTAFHTDGCYTQETATLTWDELKLAENGKKYGYDASKISDTQIGESAFKMCHTITSITLPSTITHITNYAFNNCTLLTSITLPESLGYIGTNTFTSCTALTEVNYTGTKAQWSENLSSITGKLGNYCPATVIHCSDGDLTL